MAGRAPSRHWTRRVGAGALAAACLLTTGAAAAYYTAAEDGSGKRAGWIQKYADVTDSWLDSVRSGSMFRRSGGSSGREDRGSRSRRSSSDDDSSRNSRSRSSRSSEERSAGRESSRRGEQSSSTSTRSTESSRRAIRESSEVRYTPAITTTPKASQSIRYYSSFSWDGPTYRTMCVRLCDGYYWPVSYSASKREFARDADVCQRSCDSPVALHYYRNPGQEPENMVDLKGKPYIELENAFLYRMTYDASCKCRAHPWEEASRLRHMSYAEVDQMNAGSLGKP